MQHKTFKRQKNLKFRSGLIKCYRPTTFSLRVIPLYPIRKKYCTYIIHSVLSIRDTPPLYNKVRHSQILLLHTS